MDQRALKGQAKAKRPYKRKNTLEAPSKGGVKKTKRRKDSGSSAQLSKQITKRPYNKKQKEPTISKARSNSVSATTKNATNLIHIEVGTSQVKQHVTKNSQFNPKGLQIIDKLSEFSNNYLQNPPRNEESKKKKKLIEESEWSALSERKKNYFSIINSYPYMKYCDENSNKDKQKKQQAECTTISSNLTEQEVGANIQTVIIEEGNDLCLQNNNSNLKDQMKESGHEINDQEQIIDIQFKEECLEIEDQHEEVEQQPNVQEEVKKVQEEIIIQDDEVIKEDGEVIKEDDEVIKKDNEIIKEDDEVIKEEDAQFDEKKEPKQEESLEDLKEIKEEADLNEKIMEQNASSANKKVEIYSEGSILVIEEKIEEEKIEEEKPQEAEEIVVIQPSFDRNNLTQYIQRIQPQKIPSIKDKFDLVYQENNGNVDSILSELFVQFKQNKQQLIDSILNKTIYLYLALVLDEMFKNYDLLLSQDDVEYTLKQQGFFNHIIQFTETLFVNINTDLELTNDLALSFNALSNIINQTE